MGSIGDVICDVSGGPELTDFGTTEPFWRIVDIEGSDIEGSGNLGELRSALLDAGFYIPADATNQETLYTDDDVQVDIQSYGPGEVTGDGVSACAATSETGKTSAYFSKF